MEEAQSKIKCPNCENEYDSNFNYCPFCSQKNVDLNLKFKHLVSEFFSANFNLDTKIFLTLKLLILKPAELSKEFLAGKREKYITPIRLYLLISLAYFFVLSVIPDTNNNSGIVKIDNNTIASVDSTNALITLDSVNPDTLNGFDKKFYHKLKVLDSPEGKTIFFEKLTKNISLGMFIFIPLTALILFILFYRKTKYYIPNLLFAIHLQSLIFLWLTLFNLTNFIVGSSILSAIEILFIFHIIFRWIKAFYKLTIGQTIWKILLFGIAYITLVVTLFIATFGFSFWFID